jgi:hypothetical protein
MLERDQVYRWFSIILIGIFLTIQLIM